MLRVMRRLACLLLLVPGLTGSVLAGSALAQVEGQTGLDRAVLAWQSGERTVEARRAMEDALLDSTLYFVRLPSGDGGGRFMVGQVNGIPLLNAFDTPDRLLAWAQTSMSGDEREAAGEFSGDARNFLLMLDRMSGGGMMILTVNASYAYPVEIDPAFFRFLAERARQDSDAAEAEGETDNGPDAPRTPLERHIQAIAHAGDGYQDWENRLRNLVRGQVFYVPVRVDGGTPQLAIETADGGDEAGSARLSVFDRRDLADAYQQAYEAERGTALQRVVMSGGQLGASLPGAVTVAINPGSRHTLDIQPQTW